MKHLFTWFVLIIKYDIFLGVLIRFCRYTYSPWTTLMYVELSADKFLLSAYFKTISKLYIISSGQFSILFQNIISEFLDFWSIYRFLSYVPQNALKNTKMRTIVFYQITFWNTQYSEVGCENCVFSIFIFLRQKLFNSWAIIFVLLFNMCCYIKSSKIL